MKLIFFNDIVAEVINMEGGFVDHPYDKGGQTKYGISQRSYPNIDIKNLTQDQAKNIYFKDFWDKYHCMLVPEKFRHLYFDMLVNHGPRNATLILQRALAGSAHSKYKYLAIDGHFGTVTKEALASSFRLTLLDLVSERLLFYARLIRRKPNQKVFFSGWVSRSVSFLT